MKKFIATAAAIVAGLASLASANPRESVTYTNVISDSAASAASLTHAFAGGYSPKYITISGTLTSQIPSTYSSDAAIRVISPFGTSMTLQPFQGGVFSTATATNFVAKIPVTIPNASGTWVFSCFESFDDGGQDAKWNSLTITLDDGPPARTNLGDISGAPVHASFPLSAGQIKWYKLEIENSVSASGGTYLDIDTEGSVVTGSLTGNDTEIGLYTEDGVLVASDDDSGSGHQSQLTFGSGSRPAAGDSSAYDGRNGDLAPGTYYLAVSAYNTAFGAVGWNVTTDHARTGTVAVNIRTNTFAPTSFDLGTLSQNEIHRTEANSASSVKWFRFDVPATVAAGSNTYLDIDMEGSQISGGNDTLLLLYTSWGELRAVDDDGGNGAISQLTFGAGTRPAQGNGLPYNGRHGSLPPGTYYLAACSYTAVYDDGWQVLPSVFGAGTIRMNIRTNIGAAATCPADVDDGSGQGTPDGGVGVEDLLYFLQRFNGGC